MAPCGRPLLHLRLGRAFVYSTRQRHQGQCHIIVSQSSLEDRRDYPSLAPVMPTTPCTRPKPRPSEEYGMYNTRKHWRSAAVVGMALLVAGLRSLTLPSVQAKPVGYTFTPLAFLGDPAPPP